MKLVRYGAVGEELPGVLDQQGRIRSLAEEIQDIAGRQLLPHNLSMLAEINPESLPIVKNNPRIGPCIGNPRKFICIGLNYRDHAQEMGLALPTEPVVFSKFTSAICGPNDHIIIPKGSRKTDWEVELGFVIGKPAKYVHQDNALEHVAGYFVVNDLSERAFQLEGTGQWIKGKSCDTFGPIGPWLVTKDEIPDPQNLELWLEVDGKRYQKSSTKKMIFSVAYLVSYLSQFFTLHSGDIISTGTPAGVGLGQKPNPIYLQPGQTIHLGISGLGEQTQITMEENAT